MNTSGLEKVESSENSVTLSDAVDLVLSNATSKKRKFTESIEVILNCVLEKGETVRGYSVLQNSFFKERRVVIFVPDENQALIKNVMNAGAYMAGMQNIINDINSGKFDSDAIYMTMPSTMKSLASIAQKMGSKGLMPNAKSGTLTDNLEEMIPKMKNRVAFFKSGKTNMIQSKVGDLSMTSGQITENVKLFIQAVSSQTKNIGKNALKSVYVKSTMSKAVKVDELDSVLK